MGIARGVAKEKLVWLSVLVVFPLYGCTPPHSLPSPQGGLSRAIESGDLSRTRVLVQNKYDVNVTDARGFTPLMSAAFQGDAEIAALLLDNGAKINAQDKNGNTALIVAAAQGQAEAIEILLKRDADTAPRNTFGRNALDTVAIARRLPSRQKDLALKRAAESLRQKTSSPNAGK